MPRPALLPLQQPSLPPLWASTTSPAWDKLPVALTWPFACSKQNGLTGFQKPTGVGIFLPQSNPEDSELALTALSAHLAPHLSKHLKSIT